MKKNNGAVLFLMIVGIFLTQQTALGYNAKPPRLTVIIVVDQFAHSYLDKLTPHFKYGLKFLCEKGVDFTNAHQPAGQPGTATGHASLGSGTCAKDHGFVSNSWYMDGKKTACDDDHSGNANVLVPNGDGTYDYGKSAHMLMVDSLSDQCVLQSEPRSAFNAYSISLKSRSAIATASKLGKPLWIDDQTGLFTSSKAYFEQLPEWVNRFNRNNDPSDNATVTWQRFYQKSPYAYNFFDIDNYDHTRTGKTMLDTPLPVRDASNPKNPGHLFEKTPFANKLLLDCAQECIKTHVSRKHRDRLLLWVCLSPLDKVAHQYGQNSMEAIDMIYHLDKQLQKFIRGVYRTIGKHEVTFVLTADHGIMPIPELLRKDGLTQAQRLDRVELVKSINETLHKNHGVKDVAVTHKGQELVLDMPQMATYDSTKQNAIIANIKQCALQHPGIKHAWSVQELLHTCTRPNTIEDNIKNQLFEGRTGSVVLQTYPYTVITHWPQGSSHKTPYDYDTHVPLIIFTPGKFERRKVRQRVVAQQLANTLAELLNVQKPSASTYEILPELFDPEYQ
jgi:predicted AlkP superfamily pyrophosphatase or phosphodiesterase